MAKRLLILGLIAACSRIPARGHDHRVSPPSPEWVRPLEQVEVRNGLGAAHKPHPSPLPADGRGGDAGEDPRAGPQITCNAPQSVPCFDVAEFTLQTDKPPYGNPFTDALLDGVFLLPDGSKVTVTGFADDHDGTRFVLRFSPQIPDADYTYVLRFRGGGLDRQFQGSLRSEKSDRDGPVIVDPQRPRHFLYAGSKRHFYHMGYTAYHLLDPTNSLEQIGKRPLPPFW